MWTFTFHKILFFLSLLKLRVWYRKNFFNVSPVFWILNIIYEEITRNSFTNLLSNQEQRHTVHLKPALPTYMLSAPKNINIYFMASFQILLSIRFTSRWRSIFPQCNVNFEFDQKNTFSPYLFFFTQDFV